MITINDIQNQVNAINYLLNRSKPSIKICKQSGGLKIRFIKTNENLFPVAVTKKDIYSSLLGFKKGLRYSIDQ